MAASKPDYAMDALRRWLIGDDEALDEWLEGPVEWPGSAAAELYPLATEVEGWNRPRDSAEREKEVSA